MYALQILPHSVFRLSFTVCRVICRAIDICRKWHGKSHCPRSYFPLKLQSPPAKQTAQFSHSCLFLYNLEQQKISYLPPFGLLNVFTILNFSFCHKISAKDEWYLVKFLRNKKKKKLGNQCDQYQSKSFSPAKLLIFVSVLVLLRLDHQLRRDNVKEIT